MPTFQSDILSVKEAGAVENEEKWQSIPGFPLYEASNLGRVRRIWANNRKSLLNPFSRKGYMHISIYRNGKKHYRKVHRLVMSAFFGNSDLEVNHKNGIKADNRIENLEYCSHLHNMQHASKSGLIRTDYRRGRIILTENQAKRVKALIAEGLCSKIIAKLTNVKIHNVRAVKAGISWRSLN